MAQIPLNIPDAEVARVVNGVCTHFNYSATISNPNFDPLLPEDPVMNPRTISNPETKKQFIKRMIRETVIAWVKAEEKTPVIRSANDDFEDTFIEPDIS